MDKYIKKAQKLKFFKCDNAIILPRKFIDEGPMLGLGGVCDSNNRFCEEYFYDGGWAKYGGSYTYVYDEETYVDEEVVYDGLFLPHWRHFLIDLSKRYFRKIRLEYYMYIVGIKRSLLLIIRKILK